MINSIDYSDVQVTFSNEAQLYEMVQPYSKEEVVHFLANQYGIEVRVDSTLPENKVEPFRNIQDPHLFHRMVYQNDDLTVYYPEHPRSLGHLSLVLNRNIKGVHQLTHHEQQALFKQIKKINEVYVNKLGIEGYVVAQYASAQKRHDGRCTLEILPHQQGHKHCRDFLDKSDSNRYVLFGDHNLSSLDFSMTSEAKQEEFQLWKEELHRPQLPISEDKLAIHLPSQELDARFEECHAYVVNHLLELFENNGAHISTRVQPRFSLKMNTETELKTRTVARCAFCLDKVINRQKVIEYQSSYLLYNFRKMPDQGTSFLILPKRHTEKLYSLTKEEVDDIYMLRKALIRVLKAKYPHFEVVDYIQDAPSVGQTVPHMHEQVLALNPEKIPFTWSMMSLAYNPQNVSGGVSDAEMQSVTQEFAQLISEEIEKIKGEESYENTATAL